MKIRMNLELEEMERITYSIMEAASDYGVEEDKIDRVISEVWAEKDIEVKAAHLRQNIGEIEIDLNSKFAIFIIKTITKFFNVLKPAIKFIENLAIGAELKEWFKPVDETVEEELPSTIEFDV